MKKSKKHSTLTLLRQNERRYPTNPDDAVLESFANEYGSRRYTIRFECPEFSSLCPITNQPDFGRIVIEYIPARRCLESKSLKLYLFAFRNHNTFHEEAVNRILTDIVRAVRPHTAKVTGFFNPRGGISIQVEAAYP